MLNRLLLHGLSPDNYSSSNSSSSCKKLCMCSLCLLYGGRGKLRWRFPSLTCHWGCAFIHRSSWNKGIQQACYTVTQTIWKKYCAWIVDPLSVHSIIKGRWVIAYIRLHWSKFRATVVCVIRTSISLCNNWTMLYQMAKISPSCFIARKVFLQNSSSWIKMKQFQEDTLASRYYKI